MKKERKRKWWILWACLGVVSLMVIAAAAYVVSTLPVYPVFMKDVRSLEQIRKELKDMPEICVPEASWLELTDGTYHLDMDGRFRDAKPIGYHVDGTAQCNHENIDVSICCSPPASYGGTAQGNFQYRDTEIEYLSFSTPIPRGVRFEQGGHVYSIYIDFSAEGMSEEEISTLTDAAKDWVLEIAYKMIDSIYEGTV